MSRPAAVTAAAVLAILGSLLLACFAAMMLFFTLSPTLLTAAGQQPLPGVLKGMMVGVGLTMVAMVVWGIGTAVGLLKLRGWARISILVFAGLMAFMSVILGASTLLLPPVPTATTPGVPAAAPQSMKLVMSAIYALPLLIAVWWLVLFNRAGTRDAFAQADPSVALDGGRPISLTIIGWFMAVGGVFCLLPAIAGYPGFVLGAVFTGWSARLWYAAIGAAELYGGAGLLKLDERGRLVAIVVCSSMLLNALAIGVLPGAYARAMAAQSALWPQLAKVSATTTAITGREAVFASIWVAVVGLVPLWFLFRHKTAFRQATA